MILKTRAATAKDEERPKRDASKVQAGPQCSLRAKRQTSEKQASVTGAGSAGKSERMHGESFYKGGLFL